MLNTAAQRYLGIARCSIKPTISFTLCCLVRFLFVCLVSIWVETLWPLLAKAGIFLCYCVGQNSRRIARVNVIFNFKYLNSISCYCNF